MIQRNLLKFSFDGIFIIKKCVVFNLTSLGALKYDFVIKTIAILSFLALINSSVTTGLDFLLLIISEIISSKIFDILRFLPRFYSSIFL